MIFVLTMYLFMCWSSMSLLGLITFSPTLQRYGVHLVKEWNFRDGQKNIPALINITDQSRKKQELFLAAKITSNKAHLIVRPLGSETVLIHVCNFNVGYQTYTSNGLDDISNIIVISCLPRSTENRCLLHRKPAPPVSKQTLEATSALTLSDRHLEFKSETCAHISPSLLPQWKTATTAL